MKRHTLYSVLLILGAGKISADNVTGKYFLDQWNVTESIMGSLTAAVSMPPSPFPGELNELEQAIQQLPELTELVTYSLVNMSVVDTTLQFGMTSQQILQSIDSSASQGLMEWWLSQVT